MKVIFAPSIEAKEIQEIQKTTLTFDTHTWEDSVDALIEQVFYPALISVGFHPETILEAFGSFVDDWMPKEKE